MSTVRINDDIKKEVVPILNDLGISLSEAINIFLHQVKINNGIPFNIKRKKAVELYDGYGSYVCEYGHIHDYSKANLDDIDTNNKIYQNTQELMEDLEKE